MMDSSSHITLNSSWHTQGPYDIDVCLRSEFEDERLGSREDGNNSSSLTVVLTTSQSDPPTDPCLLKFRCKSKTEIVSATILSNARHAEIHDDTDGYLRTVRGEKQLPKGEGDEEDIVYKKEIKLDRPQSSFALKFVSLADKHHLHLYQIYATLRRVGSSESSTSNLPSQHGNIDMDRVRDLLSSQQPISQRAESLMNSIEQYQRTQSSAMQDLQEAVAQSTGSHKPGSGDASMMGRMASLLSSLQRTHLSEQVPPSSDAMMKMMTSFGGAGDTPGNESMYGALKIMCKDVTNIRTLEKHERREKPCDQEDQQEERLRGGKESRPTPPISLEDQLMPIIRGMEEQMMGRLEARLESMQAHFDLRLNRLETMLSEVLPLQRPERSGSDGLECKCTCQLEEKEMNGHEQTETERENSQPE